MAARKNITKRTVDAAQPPSSGEGRLWDEKLSGFCVRLYAPSLRAPTGRRVYAVKYRVNGRQGWCTIGEHGAPFKDSTGKTFKSLTPEIARAEAERIIAAAKRGDDPQLLKNQRRTDLTVAELIDTYLRDGPSTKLAKRQSSWATDRSNYERHVRPLIGSKKLGELTRDDIGRMLQAVARGDTATVEKTKARGKAVVRGGEGVCHRVLSSTRAMLNWAIDQGYLRGANPCAGAKLAARPAAERFLSADESAALLKVLDDLVDAGIIRSAHSAIFKLLLLTGARLNEIAALEWRYVDLDRSAIILPPARTKTGAVSGERRIALSPQAKGILQAQPRPVGAIYVFPASKGSSGHTTTAPKVWRAKVRPAAKIAGLRIHDLRHTFASMALADGASLALIGKALGHRSFRSSERYSHASLDPLMEVAARVQGQVGNSR